MPRLPFIDRVDPAVVDGLQRRHMQDQWWEDFHADLGVDNRPIKQLPEFTPPPRPGAPISRRRWDALYGQRELDIPTRPDSPIGQFLWERRYGRHGAPREGGSFTRGEVPERSPRSESPATGDTPRPARRVEGYHPTQETRLPEDRHTPGTPERRPATPQTPEQESRRAELRRRHNELVEQRIRAGDDDPARDTSLEVESAILDDIVEDVGRFSDDFRDMSTLPGQDPRDDDAFRDTLRRGHQISAETTARAGIEQEQRQQQRVQRDLERTQRQHQRAERERVNREYWDQQARLPR